jgi:hypothetical protein
MLTGYQVETVAFRDENLDMFHPACAVKQFGALTVGKAELHLTNGEGLSGVSRYDLGEWEAEEQGVRAESDVTHWLYEHPVIAMLLGEEGRRKLIERRYDKTEYRTECYACGEVIE